MSEARKFLGREWYPVSKSMTGGQWVVRAWAWTVEGRKEYSGIRLYVSLRQDRKWDAVIAIASPLYPDVIIPLAREVTDTMTAAQRYAEDRLSEAIRYATISPMIRDGREVIANLSYEVKVLEGMLAEPHTDE